MRYGCGDADRAAHIQQNAPLRLRHFLANRQLFAVFSTARRRHALVMDTQLTLTAASRILREAELEPFYGGKAEHYGRNRTDPTEAGARHRRAPRTQRQRVKNANAPLALWSACGTSRPDG